MRKLFFFAGGVAIAALSLYVALIILLPTLIPVPSLADVGKETVAVAREESTAITTASDGTTVAVRLEEITPEMIGPYLEATIKMKPGLEMWMCDGESNFNKLPEHGISRNRLLEAVASDTMRRFKENKAGDRMSKYVPLPELDAYLGRFAVGDSPWGLFADPRLYPMVMRYLEGTRKITNGQNGPPTDG